MGRSQVLYNRTKGRGRNRAGRGGRGRGDEGGTSNGGRDGTDKRHRNHWKQQHYAHPISSGNVSNSKNSGGDSNPKGKDYENEYELLLAGRDTFLRSKDHQNSSAFEEEEEIYQCAALGASICIPSMAATLNSMSVSHRLRMPLHVVASAFPSRFKADQVRDEGQKEGEEEVHADSENGDASVGKAVVVEDDADDSSANLEDWLDDACGNTQEPQPQTSIPHRTVSPKASDGSIHNSDNGDDVSPSAANLGNEKTAEAAVDNKIEDGGDGDLDDWLDSVI
ncbi:unnamed protein product [Pseudo-nitzschia multistriata]|uniref:Uncharacterized protein n=1 Tax=Pseudo-nitzschia multistriata TaxID=183589 RepID=A0A448ZQY2_9STRA|nr:unnamed protein product [Pseudo-nitzschia multistriata]